MYKVLVVDDEYLERKALRIILEDRNELNNVKIVGESGNGKDAIKVARETKPDIIFMDVKMPKMNGLKSIKNIKKELPDVKFIILTAYDEFDYVQQALKLGINDYLLKPVRPQKVMEIVLKLIKQIEKTRVELKKQQLMKDKLAMVMPYIKIFFVLDLIFERINTLEEIKARSELFNVTEMPSVVMIVDIDEFAQMTQSNNEVKRQILKREIFSVLEEYEKLHSSLMVVPINSDKILILYFGSASVENMSIREWLKKLADKIRKDIADKTAFTVTIAIGKYYSDPRMLSKSYYEALTALRQYLFIGNNAVVHFEDINNVDYEEGRYPYLVEKKLIEGIKFAKGVADINLLIDKFFQEWAIDDNCNSIVVKARLIELLGILSRAAVEAGAKFKEISSLNFTYTRKLLEIDSAIALKTWLNKFLQLLIEKINEREDSLKKKAVYKGVDYVKNNFEHNISLYEVAEEANLSEHYFSRLFKEEMGCTFVEYITKVRLDEAKRRLKNGNENISQIAQEVGYNEPGYFSKVFKKHCGMSPSQFRN
ncbi:response regulator [Iocasia frigidifontis]|uniref:Stage 0 sporulation protein A homolog n=1 Tax=Iocasia fonsfrigidae TaxID=2682810 RepID=A0A8A7KL52_9FIRM|nr:response regulator [Iocasia fonsfrigidae]QTL98814.1 response regulator [Iocasia fonsfrigidae]